MSEEEYRREFEIPEHISLINKSIEIKTQEPLQEEITQETNFISEDENIVLESQLKEVTNASKNEMTKNENGEIIYGCIISDDWSMNPGVILITAGKRKGSAIVKRNQEEFVFSKRNAKEMFDILQRFIEE